MQIRKCLSQKSCRIPSSIWGNILKKSLAFSALALVALVACWTIAYAVIGNDYILPSVWETLVAAGGLFAQGRFYLAVGNTLLRTVIAFAISTVLGIACALLSFRISWVRSFFAPVISVMRTVPTMAITLALLIWTTPRVAPVLITLLVLFPAMYAAALASFDSVYVEYGQLTQVYKVSLRRRIFQMYLPLSAPTFFSQSGAMLSMGLKITVSAEVLAHTYTSLGGMMQDVQLMVQMPELLALTVVAITLGFLLEGLCALIVRYCVRWQR